MGGLVSTLGGFGKEYSPVPINLFLIMFNALVLTFSIYAVVQTFNIFHDAETDFLFNAKMTEEPRPCGIATPDIYLLYQGLGIIPTGPFTYPQRTKWANDLRTTMCSKEKTGTVTTEAYQVRALTIGSLLKNDSLYPFTKESWVSADDAALASENRTVGHLCTQSFNGSQPGRFNSDLYGDLVERVSRAYLAAMPAFFRLDTSTRYPSGVNDEGCMNSKNPFHDNAQDCKHLAVIQSELRKAGTTSQSALMVGYGAHVSGPSVSDTPESDPLGYYTKVMPRVDEMLYRLLALTVVAQYDRDLNAGTCFRTSNAENDARKMCEQIYGAATDSYTIGTETVELTNTTLITSGAAVGGPFGESTDAYGLPTLEYTDPTTLDRNMKVKFETYQHRVATMVPLKRRNNIENANGALKTSEVSSEEDANVYGGDVYPQAKTCHMEFGDYEHFSPPSPPAQYARYESISPSMPPAANTEVLEAVVQACEHNHQWGRWDQARLFGIPDVVRPFVRGPIEETSFSIRGLGDDVVNRLYTSNLENGDAKHTAKYEMRLWTGFRLAMTTIWASILLPVIGFLIGSSTVPTAVQFLIHVLGKTTETKGFKKTVTRPEQRSNFFFFALFVGAFATFWILLVDPSSQAPHPRDDKCTDFLTRGHGGPYVTTHARENFGFEADWTVGWITVGLIAGPFLYNQIKPQFMSLIIKTISKTKDEERDGQPYNELWAWGALSLSLLIIIFEAIMAGLSGARWIDKADEDPFAALPKEADWLKQDCLVIAWVSFLHGIGIGSLTQRWVVKDMGRCLIYLWGACNAVLLGSPLIVRNTVFYGTGSNANIDLPEEEGISTLISFEYIFSIVLIGVAIVSAIKTLNANPPSKVAPAEKAADKAAAINSKDGPTAEEVDAKAREAQIEMARQAQADDFEKRRARNALQRQRAREQGYNGYLPPGSAFLAHAGGKNGYLPMIKLRY